MKSRSCAGKQVEERTLHNLPQGSIDSRANQGDMSGNKGKWNGFFAAWVGEGGNSMNWVGTWTATTEIFATEKNLTGGLYIHPLSTLRHAFYNPLGRPGGRPLGQADDMCISNRSNLRAVSHLVINRVMHQFLVQVPESQLQHKIDQGVLVSDSALSPTLGQQDA